MIAVAWVDVTAEAWGIQVAKFTLEPNHTFLSTLAPDEVNTHEHVPQYVACAELSNFFPTLVSILRQEIAQTPKSKIMLFLPTARSTALVYAMLEQLQSGVFGNAKMHIWQIHSRMSQSARNKTADSFKQATSGILVSSDVTARGIDFPLVTLVLQAGMPADAEQYVHRLGRTARAGEQGRGVLLLCNFERFFITKPVIRDLPIQPFAADEAFAVDDVSINAALAKVSDDIKAKAWQAWLGYYKGYQKALGWSVPQLVKTAHDFAHIACRYVGDEGDRRPPVASACLLASATLTLFPFADPCYYCRQDGPSRPQRIIQCRKGASY